MLKKGFIFLFVMILCCGVLPISAKDSGTYVPCDTRLWVDNAYSNRYRVCHIEWIPLVQYRLLKK